MKTTHRKLPDVTRTLGRRIILGPYNLASLEVIVRPDGCSAYALPLSHHPKVFERRDAAIEAAGGEINLVQARPINVASMKPVARGRGGSILEALLELEANLKAGVLLE